MIALLLKQAGDSSLEQHFLQEISAHVAAVKASAGAGDRRQVGMIEAKVRTHPETSFRFDAVGASTLRTAEASFPAGRFETPSIGDLRKRALAARTTGAGGRVRLWVLDGASPATDIGSLQATAGPSTLFQVASQFNCLESPGPHITPVATYFHDPTQGPRASISAFPGTLLRHYAAPDGNGKRFVQTSDGPQLNLLEAICSPGVAQVRSGYLTSSSIANRSALAGALESRFEDIRVGVHEDVPVVLGYNWDGAVAGDRRIGQVFTSTFAAGGYSGTSARREDPNYRPICIAPSPGPHTWGRFWPRRCCACPNVDAYPDRRRRLRQSHSADLGIDLLGDQRGRAVGACRNGCGCEWSKPQRPHSAGGHHPRSARGGVIVVFGPAGVSVHR